MLSLRLFRFVVLGLVVFFGLERNASAIEPDIEAGLRAGAGTLPCSHGTSSWAPGSSPFGFGLGGRAGVGIHDFWFGLSGIYYFGASTDEQVKGGAHPGSTVDNEERTTTALLGVEVGYTLRFVPFVRIRPLVGVGLAELSRSASYEPIESNQSTPLYVEPGVAVIVPIGPLFVGVDANALILPNVSGNAYASFTMHGQFGVQFGP